jgi:YHS domain-containing protein
MKGCSYMAKDVICGMKVNEDTKLKSEFQGKSFYFCSAGCKTEFDKNPLKHSR